MENHETAGSRLLGPPAALPAARRHTCKLTAEPVDGPYDLPPDVVRKNITDGRTGVPMALRIRVVDAGSGDPIPAVVVEVWHGDTRGVYSTVALRGAQVTDEGGYAEFATIFPGWHAGRAVHVHANVHRGHVVHSGQFFFAEDLTRTVAQLAPYRSNPTARLTNTQDPHHHPAGMLTVVPRDRYHLAQGLLATVTVAVDTVAPRRAGRTTRTMS